MTNKLYIIFKMSVILNMVNLFDAKQPITFLQSAVSYLIPLSLRRGVRGEVN